MGAATETLADIRARLRTMNLADEATLVRALCAKTGLGSDERAAISAAAADLVREVRSASSPGVMESFLGEYGLSTREGVALMCLAEALLRVPDAETIDALIEDKIVPSEWGKHLGQSSSSLVNASTWALLLTGKVLDDAEPGVAGLLHGAIKRLGEGVIRTAVGQAMRELGRQFVLGRTIDEAIRNSADAQARGYTYSYDMLGEAARTDADSRRYHLSYSEAITALAPACRTDDTRDNPGISVKFSALHPRYEFAQRERVMAELVGRARSLALIARSANMGFNIDAEEADRLDLSLDVIEAVLSEPALAGWSGFGVVVQAYGRRAREVLDWLYALGTRLDRRIMVRLVKGAYWDTEIKRAQVLGLSDFPVFTRKVCTDVSYMACARQLLGMRDRVYAQFATHNAHTVASVLAMAGGDSSGFEFQRLHGMGEALHDAAKSAHDTRCRIYAPVGAHRDLLAYLVRRLLENGANSSFVNQIVDEDVSADEIARDPVDVIEGLGDSISNPAIAAPAEVFGTERKNAQGWDITDCVEVAALDSARGSFRQVRWAAAPALAEPPDAAGGTFRTLATANPAHPADVTGEVRPATEADIEAAIVAARAGAAAWSTTPERARADALLRAADLYERHAPELFALATREAGKTLLDGVAEVREAVDFLRYYALEGIRVRSSGTARGVFVCISPWNFPLAIFTGQLAAALAAGNAVLAKPAEQTPLIAARAVALLHEAGVPAAALQLLPGDGPNVGAALVGDPRVDGVCFTGSTRTAQLINRQMSEKLAPDAPLIAETGGLNAMIVDSTALPEQAVRDIVASAFQSAGQRCSALRILYIQTDVCERVLEMLYGAMDELRMGDPWLLSTDIGPTIDAEARERIEAHCARWAALGRVTKRLAVPADLSGHFVPPTVIEVDGIESLEEEIFGPVLHVATFEADEIDGVLEAVNRSGYGLTFGLHTRIDDRVQHVVDRVQAGNVYVNRNQIGAVVGSQPFGGEGLSGTGPKAGGPAYVRRFLRTPLADGAPMDPGTVDRAPIEAAIASLELGDWHESRLRLAALGQVAQALELAAPGPERDDLVLPGPTGESNRLRHLPRGVVLCLGPSEAALARQALSALHAVNGVVLCGEHAEAIAARLSGTGAPVAAVRGQPTLAALRDADGFAALMCAASVEPQRAIRQALAEREGPLLPLVADTTDIDRLRLERHVCVDTTAAGGNASLLAAAE